jgi:DnaJ family protein A protein 2
LHLARSIYIFLGNLGCELTLNRWGEKERLIGEADQVPGKPPGDLVIVLVPSTTAKKSPSKDDAPPEEDVVSTFERQGKHLFTKINLTLAEALFGFSKIVVKHLDGRGIHLNYEKGNVLQPGQVIKVSGEGMPVKKQNYKGDLYLVVNVKFPEGTLLPESRLTQFHALVPQEAHNISAKDVDEVDFEIADLADLENDHDEEDTDNEEETQPHPQCAQQ